MKFSQAFGLGKSQAELDFIDVDTSRDTRVYVDPYAISVHDDELSVELSYYISTFFEDLLASLRANETERAEFLTSHLGEPQETFLGMSQARPQGRGIGRHQADQLLEALTRSRAFSTGLLTDLAEAELFVDGVGPDRVSDMTTNILRGPLIQYTREQCALHGVPLNPGIATAARWYPDDRTWRAGFAELPVINGSPVILVPKVIVRRRMSLDSQEYYNHTVLNFLQAEHINANSGLVRVFRSGRRHVYKKDLKARHEFSKSFLAEFSEENQQILEMYKNLKGARGALERFPIRLHHTRRLRSSFGTRRG